MGIVIFQYSIGTLQELLRGIPPSGFSSVCPYRAFSYPHQESRTPEIAQPAHRDRSLLLRADSGGIRLDAADSLTLKNPEVTIVP